MLKKIFNNSNFWRGFAVIEFLLLVMVCGVAGLYYGYKVGTFPPGLRDMLVYMVGLSVYMFLVLGLSGWGLLIGDDK